jgi:hypothetical protein
VSVPRDITTWTVRLAGFLVLLSLATGIFAEFFVLGRLIVPGNVSLTAHNIQASETLYRIGFGADLVDYTAYAAATVILYHMFKPVSESLSLAAAAFSLVGSAVVASISTYYLAPLVLLGAPVLPLEIHDTLALISLSLRLRSTGYTISLIFFGLQLILLGLMLFRSKLLPVALGGLLMLGGAGYLTNSFVTILSPAGAWHSAPIMLLPGVVAQGALALALLFNRWERRRAVQTRGAPSKSNGKPRPPRHIAKR